MRTLTRLLNLVAGALVLAAGIYLDLVFGNALSNIQRLVMEAIVVTYFITQVGVSLGSHNRNPNLGNGGKRRQFSS